MSIALYARVSSERQEREQTIDSQVAALEAFALRLEGTIERYADDGFHGGTLERPAMSRLRQALAAGLHEALVVYDIDRLSRDQADLYQVVYREVIGRGVALYVAKTGARFEDTAEGDALFAMFAAFAKIERRRIGERARRGAKHRAAVEGRKNGGIAAFGFALEDGRYVLVPDEVAWCRRMSEWLLEGITPGRIAERLSLHGVGTRYDTLGIVRKGSRRLPNTWYPDQVRKVLTDRLYAGEWVYHAWDGSEVVVPVPAIFTPAEQQAHRLQISRNIATRKRADGPLNILRGLVVCGKCGRRYVAGYASSQRIYRCGVWHHPKRLRDCANKGWTAKRLEGIVWSVVEAFLQDPVTALAAVEAQGHDTDQPELRIAQLERRLAELDAEDARVRDGFRQGIWDAAGTRAELERSAKARKLIDDELIEIRSRVAHRARMADLEQAAAELRAHLPVLSHDARGAVLAELVERITVTEGLVEIQLIVPTRETGQAVPGDHAVVLGEGLDWPHDQAARRLHPQVEGHQRSARELGRAGARGPRTRGAPRGQRRAPGAPIRLVEIGPSRQDASTRRLHALEVNDQRGQGLSAVRLLPLATWPVGLRTEQPIRRLRGA